MRLPNDTLHNYKHFINVHPSPCLQRFREIVSQPYPLEKGHMQTWVTCAICRVHSRMFTIILFKVTHNPHFTDGQSKQEREVIGCPSLLLFSGSTEINKLLLFIEKATTLARSQEQSSKYGYFSPGNMASTMTKYKMKTMFLSIIWDNSTWNLWWQILIDPCINQQQLWVNHPQELRPFVLWHICDNIFQVK